MSILFLARALIEPFPLILPFSTTFVPFASSVPSSFFSSSSNTASDILFSVLAPLYPITAPLVESAFSIILFVSRALTSILPAMFQSPFIAAIAVLLLVFLEKAAIPSTLIIPPPLPSVVALLVVIFSAVILTFLAVPPPTATTVRFLFDVSALLFPLATPTPTVTPSAFAVRVVLFFPEILISLNCSFLSLLE